MIRHGDLGDVIGSRAKINVVRCLLDLPDPVSGREIARRSGLSHTSVQTVLQVLEEFGVVRAFEDGSGRRFVLNRENEFVRAGLIPLFQVEGSMEERLGSSIVDAVPEALSVVMFGSVARAEETRWSDIDVLVIVPDGTDTFQALDRIFDTDPWARWGRLLSPIIWERWVVQRYWEEGLPLLRDIIQDGRLLAGTPLIALLQGARRAG